MLRTEAASGAAAPGGSGGAPGGGAGSGGLRSASPHRNAYEATIQALKPTKDAEGEDGKKARGKKYGSNVHRIKNMFLQMGTAPGPEGACDLAKGKEKPVRLSLPRASSLNESMEQGNLLKLGTSVSERVSRFDSKPDKPFSKLQETRKIFERSPQEKEATTKLLLRKERAGFQDRKLDVVVKFNGSTESLDKLDTEAMSPTVSQLSAVFEKADLRNNLHKTPGRAGPLNSKLVSKRSRVFLQGTEAGKAESRTGDGPAAPARPRPAEEEKAAGKAGRPAEKDGSVPRVQEVCKIKPVEVEESGESEAEVEAGEPVPAPELAKGAEGPAPPEPRLEGGEEPPYAEEGVKGERADEGELYDESKKEDFSEADLVDISAYSGLGEDSGGSGLDEDEEADGLYEPESSCVEIPGLSEEEEPVPNRKIQFSTAPIQVSPAAGFFGGTRAELGGEIRSFGVRPPASRPWRRRWATSCPIAHGQVCRAGEELVAQPGEGQRGSGASLYPKKTPLGSTRWLGAAGWEVAQAHWWGCSPSMAILGGDGDETWGGHRGRGPLGMVVHGRGGDIGT